MTSIPLSYPQSLEEQLLQLNLASQQTSFQYGNFSLASITSVNTQQNNNNFNTSNNIKYPNAKGLYRSNSEEDSQQSTNSDQHIPFSSKQTPLQHSFQDDKNSDGSQNIGMVSNKGVQSPIFLFGEDAQTWSNFKYPKKNQNQQQQNMHFETIQNQDDDINEQINQQISNIINEDEYTEKAIIADNNTNINTYYQHQMNNNGKQQQYQQQIIVNQLNANNKIVFPPCSPQKQTLNYINSKYVNCSQPSPTLFIRGFDINMLDIDLMHNIFSNFGNIKFIILIKSKQNVLMEFENEIHSTYAKDHLSGVYFAGGFLKIFYSNYLSIVERKAKDFKDEIYFEGHPSLYRFNQNQMQLPINPPSPVIFVDNISQQAFTQQTIIQLFSQFGKIANCKLLSKNSRNMCLIKFTSYSESFQAFSLHKKMLLGRVLNISFTKAKV